MLPHVVPDSDPSDTTGRAAPDGGSRTRHLARQALVLRWLAFLAGIAFVLVAIGLARAVRSQRAADIRFSTEAELRRAAEAARLELGQQLAAAQQAHSATLLAQASALRRSGQPGQRSLSLQLLAQAALTQTDKMALRREAAAALLLPDLELGQPVPRRTRDGVRLALDPSLQQSLVLRDDGVVRLVGRAGNSDPMDLPHPAGIRAAHILAGLPATNGFAAIHYINQDLLYWNLEYLAPVATFTNHASDDCFSTSADGRTLALTRTKAGGIDLRFLEKAGPRARFLPAPGAIAAFPSPDAGELAIARLDDATIQLVRLVDGAQRGRLLSPAPVRSCSWSYDGRWLAVISRDNRLRIWDSESLRLRHELPGDWTDDAAAQFVPGTPQLVTRRGSARVNLWDPLSARSLIEARASGGRLQVGASGSEFVVWGWDNDDLLPGSFQLRRPFVELAAAAPAAASEDRPSGRAAAFSPNERWLAVASLGGVQLWDWARLRRIRTLPATEAYQVWWQEDGRALRTHTDAGARLWRVSEVAETLELGEPSPLDAFTSDCRLAAHSADGTVRAFWSKQALVVLAPGKRQITMPLRAAPNRLEVSPDGLTLGLAYSKGEASLVRASDGRVLWTHRARPSCDLAFSPDGRWLVTGSGDEFQFWNLADFSKGRRFRRDGFQASPGPMAFSSNGKWFAYASTRTEIVLVDITTGEEVVRVENPNSWELTALGFSRSGHRLAGVSSEGVTTVWDLARLNADLAPLGLGW